MRLFIQNCLKAENGYLMRIVKRQFPPCFGIHVFSATVLRQKIGDLRLRLLANLLAIEAMGVDGA